MTQFSDAASTSPFDVDSAYLQQTLRHEPMEVGLDDSVSMRAIGLLFMRASLAGVVVWIFFAVITFAVLIQGNTSSGVLALPLLGFLASVAVFWIALLAGKVTEPIGEWRVLLADRAGSAEHYHRLIATVLARRQLPITFGLGRMELNSMGRPVKHTLVLSENEYQAYVTVFPYGTSLYVGWQMWRRRSGAQLIGRALNDRLHAANLVTAMLRTDRARAMREAVHLACREAVYVQPDDALLGQANSLQLPQVLQEPVLMPRQPVGPTLPASPQPVMVSQSPQTPPPPSSPQGPASSQSFQPIPSQPSPSLPEEPPAASDDSDD